MAITLSALCANAEATYGMKLLAGSEGMNGCVRWVHMVEDAEVPAFLHGNELIFTTGIGKKGSSWLLPFARSLTGKRAAGLVLNLGPYIPSVPAELLSYCRQHALPLFKVPWNTRLIDITYDFCHRIMAVEKAELSVAEAFRTLIFNPEREELCRPALERAGFSREGNCAAVVLQTQRPMDEPLLQNVLFQAHHLLSQRKCRFSVFFHQGRLLTLMQGAAGEAESYASDLLDACGVLFQNNPAAVGLSTDGAGYPSVPQVCAQAQAALKVALLKGKPLLAYRDMGIYKLLVSVKEPEVLQALEQEFLGPLRAHDAQNQTDYCATLRCYLEHNASVQALSQLTGVHRNTINYKIRQIRRILGRELTEDVKLQCLLAFYIQDMLK